MPRYRYLSGRKDLLDRFTDLGTNTYRVTSNNKLKKEKVIKSSQPLGMMAMGGVAGRTITWNQRDVVEALSQ